jgi:hypothetical protein
MAHRGGGRLGQLPSLEEEEFNSIDASFSFQIPADYGGTGGNLLADDDFLNGTNIGDVTLAFASPVRRSPRKHASSRLVPTAEPVTPRHTKSRRRTKTDGAALPDPAATPLSFSTSLSFRTPVPQNPFTFLNQSPTPSPQLTTLLSSQNFEQISSETPGYLPSVNETSFERLPSPPTSSAEELASLQSLPNIPEPPSSSTLSAPISDSDPNGNMSYEKDDSPAQIPSPSPDNLAHFHPIEVMQAEPISEGMFTPKDDSTHSETPHLNTSTESQCTDTTRVEPPSEQSPSSNDAPSVHASQAPLLEGRQRTKSVSRAKVSSAASATKDSSLRAAPNAEFRSASRTRTKSISKPKSTSYALSKEEMRDLPQSLESLPLQKTRTRTTSEDLPLMASSLHSTSKMRTKPISHSNPSGSSDMLRRRERSASNASAPKKLSVRELMSKLIFFYLIASFLRAPLSTIKRPLYLTRSFPP